MRIYVRHGRQVIKITAKEERRWDSIIQYYLVLGEVAHASQAAPPSQSHVKANKLNPEKNTNR